jgi:hypothetical protein
MEFEQREILPPSEQQFRQRVRDLEAMAHDRARAIERLTADNRRLRRAVRVLAQLQPERVRRAVMEGMNDA